MVKLFIGGFPLDIGEIELAKMFGTHGDISTVKIVRDKKTRICKGYAFIEMPNRAHAENAAEALNGTYMQGKMLTVNINEDAPASPPPTPARKFNKPASPGPNDERKKRPRRIA
ncbi:RNA recognition motif domain-containing protein [Mucilaginibacter agri]|uniref:RNA-binding protein n=1 Tax=Mucilaginibacter agri TaxID=2695265 RepID=A0A965ZJR2_9SPHI|nr:RNA-binding protein [Mucilaginibacter agri]NCD70982.1 RNA-binding protein [Mucilaginibacter agri]